MLRYNEPLSRHTSFKIGGPAACWTEPEDIDELLEVISFAESRSKPFIVIGNGTDILALDNGFDGVVIRLSKGFERIEEERIGAGLSLSKLIKYASRNCLSGCEFLTGIPGNLGGAIFMNAGVRSLEDKEKFHEIKDIVVDIDVLDLKDKRIKRMTQKGIDFKYRSSGLGGNIILNARLKLNKDKKENIRERIRAFNKNREWLGKIGFPTAGSVFKNPGPGKPAGMLIESCGLKGKRIGNAAISDSHANIIVNLGNATAKDVLDLIDLARTSVKQKFGISLELELKII